MRCEIVSFNPLAADCDASEIDFFIRSPVFRAATSADCFASFPIRDADRCASRTYCSPVCFALILALDIERRMLLVAFVVAVVAFLAAASVASAATCVAFSVAFDTV